jgi:hypothetical protein
MPRTFLIPPEESKLPFLLSTKGKELSAQTTPVHPWYLPGIQPEEWKLISPSIPLIALLEILVQVVQNPPEENSHRKHIAYWFLCSQTHNSYKTNLVQPMPTPSTLEQ